MNCLHILDYTMMWNIGANSTDSELTVDETYIIRLMIPPENITNGTLVLGVRDVGM